MPTTSETMDLSPEQGGQLAKLIAEPAESIRLEKVNGLAWEAYRPVAVFIATECTVIDEYGRTMTFRGTTGERGPSESYSQGSTDRPAA